MVASALANVGVTTFLPLVTEMHRWSDRRSLVDVPLFPGYVFVQIPNSAEAQLQVLKTNGVVQLVGNRQVQYLSKTRRLTTSGQYLSRELAFLPTPSCNWGSG